jgi:hypothetical protein
MENKQTAVEWLLKEINEKYGFIFTIYYEELFNQAKAMEKEQIINAYSQGLFGEESTDSISAYAKQYYNETYGK